MTPTARDFAPLEQIEASLRVTVPDAIHGTPSNTIRKNVTVIGRTAGGALLDGFTKIIEVDD